MKFRLRSLLGEELAGPYQLSSPHNHLFNVQTGLAGLEQQVLWL